MNKLTLTRAYSQVHTVTEGNLELRILFNFNSFAGDYSLTLWTIREALCPSLSGEFIDIGQFKEVQDTDIVLFRKSIDVYYIIREFEFKGVKTDASDCA